MKSILLLTPMYPAMDMPQVDTPVVHYFAKEWVKIGYNVQVVYFPVNFPSLIYNIANLFRDYIGTRTGGPIRVSATTRLSYEIDGVSVLRLPLLKYWPHTRYSHSRINSAVEQIKVHCSNIGFNPNVILSHFINPQVEIMYQLKQYYNVPTCYVSHDCGIDLKTIYSKEARIFIESWNVIGYRSEAIKRKFESFFNVSKTPSFLCYSGIPDDYIPRLEIKKDFSKVCNFIYVGTLIERKYPSALIPAVAQAISDKNFKITYVGSGGEEQTIRKVSKKYIVSDNVIITGRVNRDRVIEELNDNQIFVMISKSETFGLVYLEAMARGCITIASKDEGFDGIIKNGFNGFLCEAGNITELSRIICNIRSMTNEQLQIISHNAVETAKEMTDSKAAKMYIDNIFYRI